MIATSRIAALLFAATIVAAGTAASAQSPSQAAYEPAVERAIEKAGEGPDTLRRFLFRTRMIYNIAYADVMRIVEARGQPGRTTVAAAQDALRNDERSPDAK